MRQKNTSLEEIKTALWDISYEILSRANLAILTLLIKGDEFFGAYRHFAAAMKMNVHILILFLFLLKCGQGSAGNRVAGNYVTIFHG